MPAAPRILILLAALMIAGCTHLISPSPAEKDFRVLKTQLAQQQDQLASQQVLLNALLGDNRNVAEQQQQGFANLQDQMERLRSVTNRHLASRSTTTEGDTCPIMTSGLSNGDEQCSGLTTIGSIEGIRLLPPDHLFEARIDTGANTSSLDARDIEFFERDGDDYVRFTLAGEHFAEREAMELERPVSRFVEIIQASSKDNERRAVIELQYRIGSIERVAEFTLANRERLTYPALIGRNILRDLFSVDVSRQFILSDPDELEEAAGSIEGEG
ncbi:ATP-dependent zinc protease family protein [Halovibrio salipaludis]|nr:RimK/LysX family protein [Halovibrio salipaludis]